MQQSVRIFSIDFKYIRKGDGKPLVLIPAFHTDSNRMMPLVNYLARYFDVIMPDLPGISDNSTLGEYKYTAYNYALFIKELMSQLRLQQYVLSGFCLGASIVIHLLNMNVPVPKTILLFEAIYSGRYIYPRFPYNVLMMLFKTMGRLNPEARQNLVNNLLHNKKFLHALFRHMYRKEKNMNEIIPHQIRLTDQMNSKAWVDLIDDILATDFTQENKKWDIPAYLFYVTGDGLINFRKNSTGIKQIFPRSEVIQLPFKYHAPPSALTEEVVEQLLEPVRPVIRKIVN